VNKDAKKVHQITEGRTSKRKKQAIANITERNNSKFFFKELNK
jgi:hypothetical protein